MAETANLTATAAEPGAMAAVADPDQPPGEPGALATGILTKIYRRFQRFNLLVSFKSISKYSTHWVL